MAQKVIAVVTGASSGLGKEFVKRMTKEKVHEIWAIARNEQKLVEMKKQLGKRVRCFSLDLSDRNSIKKFEKLVETEGPAIRYLVNNAGYDKFCSYEDLSIDQSINMIDLNCSGVVAMGLACLPYMRRGSHIINIASQASFQPLPYQNIYASTKAFVRNYSRALNVELKERGICVTAVCPGWIDTGLFDRANIGAKKTIQNFTGMVSADCVAKKAMEDAKRGRDISVYSAYVKTAHVLAKVLPQRAMMKVWLWQQGM